jgi:hypothetical protein
MSSDLTVDEIVSSTNRNMLFYSTGPGGNSIIFGNTTDGILMQASTITIRSAPVLDSNPLTWSPSNSGNNFHPSMFLTSGTLSTIGGTGIINTGGNERGYLFGIESTTNSFRALGVFTNNTNSFDNNTGADWTMMGYFKPSASTNAFSFTASHRCFSQQNDLYDDSKLGLIVVSSGKYDSLYTDEIELDNAVPIVELSTKRKMKNVLGVIGQYEREGEQREGMNFGFVKVDDKDKNRLYVQGIGEGAVWVANTNGDLENGDYIQTSTIAGYGEKQDDDFLHNYTVCKITMDVHFNNLPSGFKTRTLDDGSLAVLVGCVYYCG